MRFSALDLGDEADEMLERIAESVELMARLITDLLTWARVQHEAPKVLPMEASAALRQALRNLDAEIREAGAEVICDQLPQVVADPTRVMQVFQNLVGNALKYRGADVPRVRVTGVVQGDAAVFHVSDNGIGMSAEAVERVFQPFHQEAATPSVGLGLAPDRLKRRRSV